MSAEKRVKSKGADAGTSEGAGCGTEATRIGALSIEERLRATADSSVDARGVALAVICSPELLREAADEIDRLRKVSERIERILKLAEMPSMLGPALAEMGDNEHVSWENGWIAATKFFRAHIEELP
jgi:hypothetical protein